MFKGRRMWRKVSILAVLVAGTVFEGCDSRTHGTTAAIAGTNVNQIQTNTGAPIRAVVQKPVPSAGIEDLVLPGTVEAWEVAPLYARVTGYLESVSVDIGDQVESGAEVARIVVPEMDAQLHSAEARIERVQAELELARLTSSRQKNLRDMNPEAIAQQEVDVSMAKEHIEAAQLDEARADRDRLRALSTYARLQAPFAGRITRRFLDPGALAREGTSSGSQPVVEIARTDRLRLAFEVPEKLVPHVKEGMPVVVQFDAFPGARVDAVIARLAGSLDMGTRSMRAEIDLENVSRQYQPGMYASIHIAVHTSAETLTVPSRAVRGQGDERYCLIAQDGILRRRPVVVAWDDGHRAGIVRGLDHTNLVMVAGSTLAGDGVRVEAIEEQMK